MAAQVATLNTSPPSELKKPDRDTQEEPVPGEKQHENKDAGADGGSPRQKELQDGAEAAGGGDPDMKNGTLARVNNNGGNQNDTGGLEGNAHPGMGHHHQGPFPPPPYVYNQHYSRAPFHQHGGQQSPGMAAASGPSMMDPYPPNSHEHGYPNSYNNYSPFAGRTSYQGQGYGAMNSPRSSQPPAAGGQSGKQQPPGASAAMATSYNNQRYNIGNPQPTSTPTLNQLLTSPSSARSYPNYPQGDYNNQEGPNKAAGDMSGSQYSGVHPSWSQRGHHPPPMSPGNTGQPASRNQVKPSSSGAVRRAVAAKEAAGPRRTSHCECSKSSKMAARVFQTNTAAFAVLTRPVARAGGGRRRRRGGSPAHECLVRGASPTGLRRVGWRTSVRASL
ncbi:AT-rich interactive domain-containing protein 1A, partial [Oryzias melastigma]